MVDYDFSTLNDKEFEDITLELISRDRKKKYQRFSSAKSVKKEIYFSIKNKGKPMKLKIIQ